MAVQISTAGRNARIDALVAAIGASPLLEIFTGGAPANPAAADTGTKLASAPAPSTWMNAASGGSASKAAGTWQDASADNPGTAAHFRLKDSTGTTVHLQGTVTATGGGGDLTVDNTNFAAGQTFSVTGFTLTDANA